MRIYKLLLLLTLLSCEKGANFRGLEDGRVFLASLSADLEQEEIVLEETKSLLDILIVADSSQSMYHHLGELGRSLSDMLSVISHYDWQIGITSSDHGDHQDPSVLQESWKDHILEDQGRFGGLMFLEDGEKILRSKILTPQMSDYESIFFHSISHSAERDCERPPYCHARLEQPLRSLSSAMQRASLDNRDFFRSEADLISLIITNEDERVEDKDRATSANEVIQTFNKKFGHLDKKFIAFNIIIKDENCLRIEKSHAEVAHIAHSIAKLADLTGGYNISICSKNYAQSLKNLSKYIKNSLENSILLKKEPVPGSLKVEFIDSRELDWKVYGRNIVFDRQDSGPLHVSISYQSED